MRREILRNLPPRTPAPHPISPHPSPSHTLLISAVPLPHSLAPLSPAPHSAMDPHPHPHPHPHPQPQSHISPGAPFSPLDLSNQRVKKQRGSYNCRRCGLPKKGHQCHIPPPPSTPTLTVTVAPQASTPHATTAAAATSTDSTSSRPVTLHQRQQYSHLRRALSFDDIDMPCGSPELEMLESEPDLFCFGSGKLPAGCLWEVLRRLPPAGLLAAAGVCRGWRDTAKRLWKAAEELRLRVPPRAQLGFVGSLLQKCPGLVRLSLRMERSGSCPLIHQI